MWMACSYGLTAVGFYSMNCDIAATKMMVGVDSVRHCYNHQSHWSNVSTALIIQQNSRTREDWSASSATTLCSKVSHVKFRDFA
ncbi:hypothetical protein OPV22_030606 [Ensete ventricosum]|uniref:Secreted protein n=1 Tax=Ensete ventricosum TaxID=4639 RepID=A0AAV8QGK8_ENSVE|nr:hypothetical protein OPV22_030606 [Ensete ventricosum]